MPLVTIGATWLSWLWFHFSVRCLALRFSFGPRLATVHALLEPLLDELVAFPAGGDDVGGVERRSTVRHRMDTVGTVAVCTDGRYRKSRVFQGVTVYVSLVRVQILLMAVAT